MVKPRTARHKPRSHPCRSIVIPHFIADLRRHKVAWSAHTFIVFIVAHGYCVVQIRTAASLSTNATLLPTIDRVTRVAACYRGLLILLMSVYSLHYALFHAYTISVSTVTPRKLGFTIFINNYTLSPWVLP